MAEKVHLRQCEGACIQKRLLSAYHVTVIQCNFYTLCIHVPFRYPLL